MSHAKIEIVTLLDDVKGGVESYYLFSYYSPIKYIPDDFRMENL